MATKIEPKLSDDISAAISGVYSRISAKQRRRLSDALAKLIMGWASYPTAKERGMYVKEMMEKCDGLLPRKAPGGLVFKRAYLFEENLRKPRKLTAEPRGGGVVTRPYPHRRHFVVADGKKSKK